MEEEENLAVETKYVLPLVTFSGLIIVAALIAFILFAKQDPSVAGQFQAGDNCNVVTCPSTIITNVERITGPPGRQGAQGVPGDKGDRGDIGPIGESGAPGMCIANPMCGVGPQGIQGIQGPKGDQGAPGFRGEKGDPGVAGPQGIQGVQGIQGEIGPIGPIGPQGIPGVCDCFNSTQTFDILVINTSLQLQANSTITCGIGSTIDPSCLVLGACPNFSPCNLLAYGLSLRGGTGILPTQLIVGGNGTTAYAYFGDILAPLEQFITYIKTILIQGEIITIQQYTGSPFSNSYIQMAMAQIELFSPSRIRLLTSGAFSSGIQLQAETGGIRIINQFDTSLPIELNSISSIISRTDNVIWSKFSNDTWLKTEPTFSYWYNQAPGTQNFASQSIYYYNDIVMNNTRSIVSTGSYLQLGPNIDVGFGNVHTAQQFLRLGRIGGVFMNSTSISMEGIVLNANVEPLQYDVLGDGHMWFNDAGGFRFGGGNVLMEDPIIKLGTGAFNDTACYIDTQTQILNSNTMLPAATGNLSAGHVLINDDVRITGNLLVDGQISGMSCSGGCVSDRNVKENITTISIKSSINRLEKLEPVSYYFKKEHQKLNRDISGGKYHGLIAQDVEYDFPWAVKKLHNSYGMKELYILEKDQLIPDMINTIKYLIHEVKQLKKLTKRKRRKNKQYYN